MQVAIQRMKTKDNRYNNSIKNILIFEWVQSEWHSGPILDIIKYGV